LDEWRFAIFPHHRKMRISIAFPMGILAALLAIPACSRGRHQTGSVNLSVHSVGATDVSGVAATVSGPAMPAPKTFPLSKRGGLGTWGATIGFLPVGNDYLFEVAGESGAAGVSQTVGTAFGIAIGKDQVPGVVITARQAAAEVPFDNAAPIIDSLVLSSTSVLPDASITIDATVHDPNADDMVTFAWSSSPAIEGSSGFSAPSAAETSWTAPSAEGDQTLLLTVTDNHGASASTSIIVHVSLTPDVGQADVEVTFNDWPVVTDLVANPGNITFGSPTALTVVATDGDGDALSYAWTSTCASGTFSSTTAPATSFTLPAGTTRTSCYFVVAVLDGRGGSTTGQTTLPVGKPVITEAPAITSSVQSIGVVGANGSVNLSIEASDPQGSPLTYQWVATAGTLSNQVDGAGTSHVVWTAPPTTGATFTITAIATDAAGASVAYDFPVSTAEQVPVSVPVPRSASWLLAGALALLGSMMARRQRV
jgi:hypothetical protein